MAYKDSARLLPPLATDDIISVANALSTLKDVRFNLTIDLYILAIQNDCDLNCNALYFLKNKIYQVKIAWIRGKTKFALE